MLVGLLLPVIAVVGWPLVRRLDDEGVIPERQAALLRGIPLFAMLPLAALERVATGMREVRFAPGERLMTQGDRGDTFVVIEEGAVDVVMDGRTPSPRGSGRRDRRDRAAPLDPPDGDGHRGRARRGLGDRLRDVHRRRDGPRGQRRGRRGRRRVAPPRRRGVERARLARGGPRTLPGLGRARAGVAGPAARAVP